MKTQMLVRSALIASLMAATSFIILPIGAVPVTLQVMFALLAGVVLGPVYGPLSMLIYVLMGAVGLPVFAGGKAGIGTLIGPTGGYIIGFVVAAAVIGWITSAGRRQTLWLALAMASGLLVIYVLGVAQLAFVLRISVRQAILLGLVPFIVADLIKAVVVVEIARRLKAYHTA